MASLNKVMLIGNVTRDPEIRFTPKGTPVIELGLAMNRRYTTDNGEKMEETTYVDVTFWGRQAETINQYIKKGRPIYVEGRLQLDSWEDKTSGQKRSRLRIVGDNFQFLGQGGDREEGGGSREYGGAPQRSSGGAPSPSQRPPQRSAPERNTDNDEPRGDYGGPDEDDPIPF